jgi:hypothetical protein
MNLVFTKNPRVNAGAANRVLGFPSFLAGTIGAPCLYSTTQRKRAEDTPVPAGQSFTMLFKGNLTFVYEVNQEPVDNLTR